MESRGTATILHLDLDAFYASVEQRDRPELRGRPVAVGGGVVLAASYEARRHGVRSGMGGRQARELCPGLIFVAGRMASYVEASDAVFDLCRRYTPLVEPISIDEAFLDVAGSERLFGPAAAMAAALRAQVKAEVGLIASVGAATTKFLAKVGSRVAKPDGLVVVDAGTEIDVLHHLGVEYLWGVGPVTQEKLAAYGIIGIGQLAELGPDRLAALLGPSWGRHLHALAWNRDPRGVVLHRRAKSLGSQSAIGGPVTEPERWRRSLLRLAERVGGRLRKSDLSAYSVTVRARFADYTTASRRRTFAAPVCATAALYKAAVELLDRLVAEDPRAAEGLTLVGITTSKLVAGAAVQMELPIGAGGDEQLTGSELEVRGRALDAAVDELRQRMGRDAVRRASLPAGEEIRSPVNL